MKQQWDKTYESLVYFKDELETYFSALPQSASLKKMQNKVNSLWKEAIANIREFDKFVSPVSPVEILFPDKNEKFINTWNFYKEYLSEQHGITMRSRMETKALKLLWELAEEDPIKAVEYLNYAMARGYRNFFKPDPNQKNKPDEERSSNPFA